MTRSSTRPSPRVLLALAAAPLLAPAAARAQGADSSATVRLIVRHGAAPVEGAIVRAPGVPGPVGGIADAAGRVVLRVPAGPRTLVVGRVGFRPDTLRLLLRAGQDTSLTVSLAEQEAELAAVVVSATRAERRVEDTPLRVEVIDEEEVAEKVAMTPGDIAMMLNETSGLRVQPTNPSLGGAGVRVQGLQGRYALLLADGLPLHGGQGGGLGLLQVPPVDLARVEIIKGTASALYGGAALGGVVNLLSRRPGDEAERTVLVNQTTRGGTDGVFFGAAPLGERWGGTLLAGAHRQRRNDLDDDGWTDMPGYERVVIRPRAWYDDGAGRSAFLTAGVTAEDRAGGTLPGRTVPGGGAFEESLRTRRWDAGGLARWVVGAAGDDDATGRFLRGAIVSARGSAFEQHHAHRFGAVRERDRHRTWFGEAAVALPRGRATWVAGAAWQRDEYRNEDVAGFDFGRDVPAVFAQADVDAAPWLALSASARLDAHEALGTVVNPRLSVLLRRAADGALAGWTTRLSGGTGAFAPVPFIEETEATGLAPVVPPAALRLERARSASLDVGGPLATALGRVEVNATAFGSRVAHALRARPAGDTTATGIARLALAPAPAPVRTWGGELLVRLVRELGEEVDGEEPPALRVTATYTHLRSTECDPQLAGCRRREVPLTPRHAAGLVAALEHHDRGRIGVEVYHTGRQALDDDPYRATSRAYTVLGLLGERVVSTRAGVARLFVNLENLTGVRQTRWDPLLRATRAPGGRWTTDAWTELAGFTANAGVRVTF